MLDYPTGVFRISYPAGFHGFIGRWVTNVSPFFLCRYGVLRFVVVGRGADSDHAPEVDLSSGVLFISFSCLVSLPPSVDAVVIFGRKDCSLKLHFCSDGGAVGWVHDRCGTSNSCHRVGGMGGEEDRLLCHEIRRLWYMRAPQC